MRKIPSVYKILFPLVLLLPLLQSHPLFYPSSWGQATTFRIIMTIIVVFFVWHFLFQRSEVFFQDVVEKLKKRNVVFYSFFTLLGIYFLATVFSEEFSFSMWGDPARGGGFVNYAFIMLFAFLAYLIFTKEWWKRLWQILLGTGLVAGIIAVLQWDRLPETIYSQFRRPAASMGNPIILAMFLIPLAFISLSFMLEAKERNKKILYGALFAFLSFVILITATRAAFIALFVGVLYFLATMPCKEKKTALVSRLGVLVIILAGAFAVYVSNMEEPPSVIRESEVVNHFTRRLSLERLSGEARIGAYLIGVEAIKERPVLGYGPENFSVGFDKHFSPDYPNIEPDSAVWWDRAHNIFIEKGVESGLLGLLAFLTLSISSLFYLRRSKEKNLAKGVQAALIAFLVAGFFSIDGFGPHLAFFLLIAYTLHLTYE